MRRLSFLRPAHIGTCRFALLAAPALVVPSARAVAQASPPPAAAVTTTAVTVSNTPLAVQTSSGLRLNVEDVVRVTTFPQQIDSTWAAVKAVYSQLRLPANTLVDADRRIAVQALRVRDKLAGDRLSKLVACGRAPDGRDASEAYEVTIDVVSTVSPAGGGHASLYSAVTAVARPVFTAGDPVRCVSTGRLEERIAGAVDARRLVASMPR